jgi:hypothetical protein
MLGKCDFDGKITHLSRTGSTDDSGLRVAPASGSGIDLTTGTGRFNLVQGFLGTVIAIAASASTGATGFIFEHSGRLYGFLILAGAAATATVLLWTAMQETKPGKYLD